MKFSFLLLGGLLGLLARPASGQPQPASLITSASRPVTNPVFYRSRPVQGVRVFYREAGPATAPAVVLLHGFPTSSRMYRQLIPQLAATYHVIAPDLPGFGYTERPARESFAYGFASAATLVDELLTQLGVTRYVLYLMDFGGSVGWRLVERHPDRLAGLVLQNCPLYPPLPGNTAFRNLAPMPQPVVGCGFLRAC